jgi:methionyl-tRNA synthetase
MITIDEFRKVELRTAKVLDVQPHPNADRLFVVQVEVGAEKRQIVAGIRGHYTAEQLVGKTIVLAANLQPAMLRGVESQGMLLAVRDGDRVVALTTDQAVATGLLVT